MRVLIREKFSRWIRWTHWLNVPFLFIMIWSGLLIYWANPQYIPFPRKLSRALHMEYQLAEGMGWHFAVMWLFTLNGLIYIAYLIWSGEWREVVPVRGSFRDALRVIAHDLYLDRLTPKNGSTESGVSKFNGAQRFAYTGALLLGAFVVITGFAILKPVQASWLTELLGGYEAARFQHFVCMCGLIAFTLLHVLQVLRAGWNHLRAMIAGYEIVKSTEGVDDDSRS